MNRFFAGVIAGCALGLGIAACMGNPPAHSSASADEAAPPAPAYMLVLGTVNDRAAFGRGYAANLPPLYERFGGEYVALGRGIEVLEGDYGPESYVIGKWPSMDAARAFWNSPEYDALRRARIDNNWGDFDVLLIEGLPVPTNTSPMVE